MRTFTDATLAEWELERFREDAVLVASELAANAVVHARTRIRLILRSDGLNFVRVELADENPRLPTLAPPLPAATSGRGLSVVDAVAGSWGIESADDGKTIWAVLGHPPPPPPPPDCIDLTAGLQEEAPSGDL